MGFITLVELNKKLKNKEINHLYYFYGEEHSLIEETIKEIEKILLIKPEEKEIFYGSDIDIDTFISSLTSLSLFGEKKFIIVKESNKIKKSSKEILQKNLKYIGNNSYLIFINPEKIKKEQFQNEQLIKEIAKIGDIVEFKQLYPEECIKFIKEELLNKGKFVSDQDIELFLELTGNNLLDIKNEIEKLVLFIGDKKEISTEDIYNCSGLTKQQNLHKLSETIISGDTQNAILIFNNLLNTRTEISHILNSINRTFQQLLTANILFNSNISKEEILKKLKMNVYFGSQFIDKAKKFSKEKILRKMEIVYRMELRLKSGKTDVHEFEVFISNLCRN